MHLQNDFNYFAYISYLFELATLRYVHSTIPTGLCIPGRVVTERNKHLIKPFLHKWSSGPYDIKFQLLIDLGHRIHRGPYGEIEMSTKVNH